MGCWCKSNKAERTKLIAENTDKSADLTNEIQSLRAKSEQLSTDLAQLNTELGENQHALDTAVELRKKDLHEFTDSEKDMMGSISQLDGAESALKKHQAMVQG